MLFVVLSGFVLAVFAPLVHRVAAPVSNWLLALLPAGLTWYFAQFLADNARGEPQRFVDPWAPDLGVSLSFYVDGLSLVFALLICGIGTLIVIYAGAYLKGHANLGRFHGFILSFMASMLGLVLADNIITLFIFWELTSVTSFLLIGFSHRDSASRRSAVQALVVTGGGGLSLLAGLLLLSSMAGSMELSVILASPEVLQNHALYLPALILVLGGAFSKSAQVPLHFWLPNAMAAPTPVSAYLHSATMVKAGVYLLARMNPGLGGTEVWTLTLVLFGGATLLVGTILAIRQTDLKLMLAYTTVASLGLLVMLIGIGNKKAIEGAMLYLVAHSLFKGALFMVAGTIDHETGTRKLTDLGGLRGAMPITFAAAALAALSMGGMPPFFGFYAKEYLYAGTYDAGALAAFATAAAVAGNVLMFGVAGLIAIVPFLGDRRPTPKTPHEGGPGLWLGPVVLSGLALIAGLLSVGGTLAELPSDYIIGPAYAAVAGEPHKVHLHIWEGFKPPLYLSVLTIGLGALTVWQGRRVRAFVASVIDDKWGMDRGYDQLLLALNGAAREVTQIVQSGRMKLYMLVTFVVLVATLAVPMLMAAPIPLPTLASLPDIRFYEAGLYLLAACGALAVIYSHSRIRALVSVGVLGTAVALMFLLYGAPDLSFTQFMVETLSVVVLALVLVRLPVDGYDRRSPASILIHSGVGIAVGILFSLLLYSVLLTPLDTTLSDFFTAKSYPDAFGRNIVNVILVDFRALDTFGEIAVVLVAGIAALALIRVRDMRRQDP
ncbi:MAG: putative monovalent cation/H+ antiporter subunit A [Pseudomonadota bacterium]